MKHKTWALSLALLLALASPAAALDAEELVPVGSAVGIELEMGGVLVVGLADVETAAGTVRPAADAGIAPGDLILSVNGRETRSAAEFLTAVGALDGKAVTVVADRDGTETALSVQPAQTAEGAWQLGLWLRDGVSGIGTVTFYDPASGTFGALGHGVNDLDSGELLPCADGCITGARVTDVVRGERGKAGELCGEFDRETVRGALEKNTARGIFGSGDFSAAGAAIPVADEDEVTLGPASILSNVRGDAVEEFDIEISRIYRGCTDSRFLLLTVTDQELLDATGGIVQGMSGSPILQNGKIVGAVTHVLLSDPARGYGISIEEMLEAA